MTEHRTFSFVSIPRIEIVEVILGAGFDGVLFDLEHGTMTIADLPPLIAAATALGGQSLVRVHSSRSENAGKALDAGATGIVFPRIGTAEAAVHAVEVSRFSRGRGFNPFVRAGRYGTEPDFAERSDQQVKVICMIEGAGAVENADSIMEVDGVDGIFVGPYDLSASLGRPGETKHPDVISAIDRVIEGAQERGVSIGVFASTAADARGWITKGTDMVFVALDAAVLAHAYRDLFVEIAE